MQALRVPALHAAAASRACAAARPAAAARCVSGAARRCVAAQRAASARLPARSWQPLRVRAASTVDVTPIDVTDVTKGRVVVVGGNGFVGSAVCKACVAAGLPVTSVSRSGAPRSPTLGVDYMSADCTDAAAMSAIVTGASAVVSCVGGFGDNATMLRVNGAANEAAVAAAFAAGVPRFVFVSVHRYNVPEALTDSIGYFKGKRAAEKAVLSTYGASGSVLQPGFIFGDRVVGSLTLPLGAVGAPLERALRSAAQGPFAGVLKALAALPASDALLAPPVAVEAVAAAAVRCATGAASGVFDIDGINALAEAQKSSY